MKYKKSTRVHFMGIGGSGVSSLAKILHEKGLIISGCDQSASPFTKNLIDEGISVKIGHQAEHIRNIDLLIHTSALNLDHPEILAAKKQQIPILSYPQAIGLLTNEIQTIAICGTHGKTTTTAFTYFAFKSSTEDPALIVGSTIPQLNNINGSFGDGNLLILEACEYKRNFLNYNPTTIVITNLELDHLDYYKDQNDYISAFIEFTERLPENSNLIVNGDDQNITLLIKKLKKTDCKPKITTFGIGKNNDYFLEKGVIYRKSIKLATLNIKLPGLHNQMNALAAFTVAHIHNKQPLQITEGLSIFQGTGRRMELLGEFKGSIIYDDYAHHPSELKATLSALKEKFPTRKILAVFQPHQYSRTFLLQEQFATAFSDADNVIIADIYESRDSQEAKNSISAQKLAEKISKHHPGTIYGGSIEQIAKHIRSAKPKNEILITLGAGDIWELSHQLADS